MKDFPFYADILHSPHPAQTYTLAQVCSLSRRYAAMILRAAYLCGLPINFENQSSLNT